MTLNYLTADPESPQRRSTFPSHHPTAKPNKDFNSLLFRKSKQPKLNPIHPEDMPIIRNPFSKRPDLPSGTAPNNEGDKFEKVDTIGSRTSSSAMSISSNQKMEPAEYKMSGKLVPSCLQVNARLALNIRPNPL